MPMPCSSLRISITLSTSRNGYRCGNILSTTRISAASSLVTDSFMTTVSIVGRFGAAFPARQFGKNRHFPEPLFDGFCRRAAPPCSGRHIAMHDADRGDLGTLADGDVVVQSNPRAQHDKVLKRRTAGNSRLRDHDAMPANADIVTHLNK